MIQRQLNHEALSSQLFNQTDHQVARKINVKH